MKKVIALIIILALSIGIYQSELSTTENVISVFCGVWVIIFLWLMYKADKYLRESNPLKDEKYKLVKGSNIHCGECDRHDDCEPSLDLDCARPGNEGMIYKKI